MLEKLRESGVLEQAVAVFEIERRFGKKLIYSNKKGNPAIEQDVLDAFKALTEGDVVWERDHRLWRWREPYDVPGSRMG